MMNFKGKDILSIADLSKKEIIHILETARKMERMERLNSKLLDNKIMASLFFEPSTRTRLSFEASMNKLGGRVIGFSDEAFSSTAKGETLYDSIKMVEQYADVIVIRHPLSGSARLAADASSVPVINAGDGPNQHPTQTLIDLYTIKKTQGKLTGLKIAMVGDLKYGRTVHSLSAALSKFNCTLYFVSPESLDMPKYIKEQLDKAGTKFSEHREIEEVINKVDILYWTRIQRERFPDERDYERIKNEYVLNASMLKNVKKNMKILHPLPRVNEINVDVDDTAYAHYFEQAANGIPVRKAVLALILGAVR